MKEISEEKRISISTKVMYIVAAAIVVIRLITTLVSFILGFVASYSIIFRLFNNVVIAVNSICNIAFSAVIVYALAEIVKFLYEIKTKK